MSERYRHGGGSAWRALMAAGLALGVWACGGDNPDGPTPSSSPSPTQRPNMIVVMLDDLDASTQATMPRIKSLMADQGLTFSNMMMSTPLCGPNRATFLTGLYAHNHGVISNAGAQLIQPYESNLLPVWLKQAGYRTSLAGKYINQYPTGAENSIPPGWDDWHGVLEDRGAGNFDYWINDNGAVSRSTQYQTSVLAQRAVDFINASEANDSQPFFILITPGSPHSPAEPEEKYEGRYAGMMAPRTDAFDEDDVSDKPFWVRRLPNLSEAAIYEIDSLYSKRLESLLSVEDLLDRVIGTLSATGELSNTFIFFTSDNGVFTGQHRIPGGKNGAYDPAARVPLLVRGPGLPAGRVLPHLVGTVDLPATLLELAGGSAANLDGLSMAPLLTSNPAPIDQWRKEILVEGFLTRSPVMVPEYGSIRTDRYTHIHIDGGEEDEVYDLQADPLQLRNLTRVGDPAAPGLLGTLAPRTKALRTCRAASCR